MLYKKGDKVWLLFPFKKYFCLVLSAEEDRVPPYEIVNYSQETIETAFEGELKKREADE